jgi:hypothetical protein
LGKIVTYIVVLVAIAFGLHYFNVVHIPWFDFSGGPKVDTPQSVERVVGGKDATRKAADEALGDN